MITTRTYFLVFILIHFVSLGIAQSNFEIIPLEVSLQDNLEEDDSLNRVGQPQFFAPIAIPFANYSPFISVTIAWQRLAGKATDLPDFSIRYSRDGEEWIEWVPLGWDEHGGDGVERFFTNLYYLESGWKFLQIKAEGEAARSENMTIRPTIHLFNPGESDSGMGQPQNPQSRRRTVYSEVSRLELNSMLAMFDYPDPNTHSERRVETTTPLQALTMLNHSFTRDMARSLAERLQTEVGNDIRFRQRRLRPRAE